MGAAGFIACYLALAVALVVVFKPRRKRLGADRRRPASDAPVSMLSRATGITSDTIEETLDKRGWNKSLAAALEDAGVKTTPADFIIIAAGASLIAGAAGFLLGGPLVALLFTGAGVLGVKMVLGAKAGKRRAAFGEQLDDSLQLLAGSLRAGHSLLRAVDAVSQQAESPTAEEFARVINETRIGRDLNEALDEVARRMHSEDFNWVAQAIGIHREVGGDLADVLDQVAATIRDRNQIQRQVRTLSAEGKMSAYVLMSLPVAIVGILAIISPTYPVMFVRSPIGYAMIGAGVVMMTIGGLWMKKIVAFKF